MYVSLRDPVDRSCVARASPSPPACESIDQNQTQSDRTLRKTGRHHTRERDIVLRSWSLGDGVAPHPPCYRRDKRDPVYAVDCPIFGSMWCATRSVVNAIRVVGRCVPVGYERDSLRYYARGVQRPEAQVYLSSRYTEAIVLVESTRCLDSYNMNSGSHPHEMGTASQTKSTSRYVEHHPSRC